MAESQNTPEGSASSDAPVVDDGLLNEISQAGGSFSDALFASANKMEQEFRRNNPVAWWTALLAPIGVTLLILGWLGFSGGPQVLVSYLITALITFFLLGRFVIASTDLIKSTIQSLPIVGDWEFMQNLVVEPYQAFFMLTYMDLIVAVFVTFNLGLMFRIPWLGPKVGMMVYDAKFILDRYPWLRRISFFGLVIFVIFPASTTGSIGGSIFGRLLGLGRIRSLIAIVVGSIAGNLLMWQFAAYLEPVKDNVIVKLAALGLIVAIVVAIEWRYRALKRKFLAARGNA